MSFAKRLCLWLAATFLSFFLLAAVWSSVSALTIANPKTLKRWLKDSQAYSRIVDILLDNVKTAGNSNQAGVVPIDRPEVRTIAENAFSPQLLQDSTEKLLDGTYGWLQGKTKKPEITIDFTAAKQQFATGIGNYVKTRLSTLPVCTTAPVGDYDVFRADCRPKSLDPTTTGNKVGYDLLNSDGFLSNPVITAESIKLSPSIFGATTTKDADAEGKVSFYQQEQFKHAPAAYKWRIIAPFLFGLLGLICCIVIIWASDSAASGFGRVGFSLIWTGAILVISALIFNFAAGRLKAGFDGVQSASTKVLMTGLIDAVFADLNNILLWFGIGFAGGGAAALSTGFSLRHRVNKYGVVRRKNDNGDKIAPKESPTQVRERYKRELAEFIASQKTHETSEIAKTTPKKQAPTHRKKTSK